VCGDYDGTPYKAQGEEELAALVKVRNEEVAHIEAIGHCQKCGYPKT
jgi:hypothetical protein